MESSHRDDSNEHPQLMFTLRNKKIRNLDTCFFLHNRTFSVESINLQMYIISAQTDVFEQTPRAMAALSELSF